MLPFFGCIIESFASWCLDRGLTPAKVRGHLTGLRRLVSWFHCKHKQSPEDLSADDITDAQHFYRNRTPQLATAAVVFGEYLQANDRLKPAQPLRQIMRRKYLWYREGTPLKHISEVMGHRNFNSTSEYLRLDVEDLRQVALPVPRLGKNNRMGFGCNSQPSSSTSPGPKYRPPGSVTAPVSKGFESFLAKPMQDFLALHRALGRHYEREEWVLRSLDFFLVKHHPKGRIFTAAMFDGWVTEQAGVSPSVRSHWMGFLRKFCLYLGRVTPDTFIPDPRNFPKQHYQAPCLLSEGDVARLMEAAIQKPRPVHGPEHPLRRHTMRLAVLLLFCCGLRRGELLKLRLADIDTEQQVLRIDRTKFHKSRLVPLSPSVNGELRKYLRQRCDHKTPTDPSAPLIWSGRPNQVGSAFTTTGLRFNWYQICRYAGVLNYRGRPPRIHDLRHSFAVTVLQRAYETGSDPQATLPRLARYMGHLRFQFTHHYLQLTEPLRLAANDRFRRFLPANLLTSACGTPRKGGAR